MIGAIAGAQRGLQRIKDEAFVLANNMFNNTISTYIQDKDVANSDIGQQAQSFFSQQTEKLKKEAATYAKDLIKKEINDLLSPPAPSNAEFSSQ